MHDTAMITAILFGKIYGTANMKVLDVGGQNVNGSIRAPYESLNLKYLCVDIEEHPSVDVIMKPGERFPFPSESFDLIVSSSCFEHDPCFWMTFREMCRVVKKGGYIYVNAPANGFYHGYPGDNWRFYADAGQALASWASKTFDGTCYPVKVEETFHVMPVKDIWIDFVCVWKRVDEKTTDIVVSKELIDKIGPLQQGLQENNIEVKKLRE
jgi:SAM-dependent methyltransferase